MRYGPALLEDWMRKHYYTATTDIGSSGVQPWSFGQLRNKLSIAVEELDGIALTDSTSCGSEQLRQAIAARWGNGERDWVMVTHGSSEAIYLALHSLLAAGDHVVLVEPCYHSMESIAEVIGCDVSKWRLREENRFQPDTRELKKLIRKETKMVILNFPHNPTGVTLTKDQVEEIVSLVSEADAYLMWDAAFSDLVYEGEPLPDPTKMYRKAISTGTFSKCYGLPGLRFGWVMAHPQVLESLIPLRDRLTLHLSPLVEFVAYRAVMQIEELWKERYDQAKENLRYLSDWMERNAEFMEWVQPSGGVTAFPKVKLQIDVEHMCQELGEKRHVLLVPGSCFGHPQRVRLGFGGSAEELREGLFQLETYFRNYTR
ncbi:capreomycidine synthase [Brevibacillus sp. TJ4]|uniref:capreomycidine synthase n=1 Tax=Brevibacillus sp. TJ4 TaxID=3234853 RepID=UPI0037D18930